MSTTHVIKLSQYESVHGPILVQISTQNEGTLDFDLLATDGDSAFKGKVRERNLSILRSTAYDGPDAEWTALVRYVFTSKRDSIIDQLQERHLNVACTITGKDPKSTLTIAFRIQIEDIVQRLGSIELKQTSHTEGVDLFGWAVQLVGQRDNYNGQCDDQKVKLELADQSITSLQSQLGEFVKAKSEHEIELLSKFALLLNEKKTRIRNLQRTLETGKADEQKIQNVVQTLNRDRGSPTASRAQKRRAENDIDVIGSDESDGFEKMDVDSNVNARSDTGSTGSTTHSRTSTTDTESEVEGRIGQKQPANHGGSTSKSPAKAATKLPRTRALPFQKSIASERRSRGQKASKTAKQPVTQDDESTASEDDEL